MERAFVLKDDGASSSLQAASWNGTKQSLSFRTIAIRQRISSSLALHYQRGSFTRNCSLAVDVEGDAFTVTDLQGYVLHPGTRPLLHFTFNPQHPGAHMAICHIHITTVDEGPPKKTTLTFTLTGEAVGPNLRFTLHDPRDQATPREERRKTDTIDFGQVSIRSTKTMTVFLQNTSEIVAQFKYKRAREAFSAESEGASSITFSIEEGTLEKEGIIPIDVTVHPTVLSLSKLSPTMTWAVEGGNDVSLTVKYECPRPRFALTKRKILFGEKAFGFNHREEVTVTNDDEVDFNVGFSVVAPRIIGPDGTVAPIQTSGSNVFAVTATSAEQADSTEPCYDVPGFLEPGASMTVLVEFMPTITPGRFTADLKFFVDDVGEYETIPIDAEAVVPKVTIEAASGDARTILAEKEPDNKGVQYVFVGKTYPITVTVRNTSEDFSAWWRLMKLEGDAAGTAAVSCHDGGNHAILPQTEQSVVINVTPLKIGKNSIALPFSVHGRPDSEAIHHTVFFEARGPTVVARPLAASGKTEADKGSGKTIDFQSVEVLTEVNRTIRVSNTGDIPAYCIASLTKKAGQGQHMPFSLRLEDPDENIAIPPHKHVDIPVTLFLENTGKYAAEFVLISSHEPITGDSGRVPQRDNSDCKIAIEARGEGSTVLPVIVGDNEIRRDLEIINGIVELGQAFTGRQLTRTVTLANYGLTAQTVSWLCEIPVTEGEGENKRTKLVTFNPAAPKDGPRPSFTLNSPKETIPRQSQVTFALTGTSKTPSKLDEHWFIQVANADGKGGGSAKTAFSPRLRATFIEPLFKVSSDAMAFNYEYQPEHDGDYEGALVKSQTFSITNASQLDLVAKLVCPAPFVLTEVLPADSDAEPAVVTGGSVDREFAAGSIRRFTLTFDPLVASPGREFVNIKDKLLIRVERHDHVHPISLKATVAYPDVSCDGLDLAGNPLVSFGTCLNDSVQTRRLRLTNTCGLDTPVRIKWSYLEAKQEVEQAKEDGRYIPSNRTFEITPTAFEMAKGESVDITVTYHAHADTACSCTALAHIEGGPTRKLRLSGSASGIAYTLSNDTVEMDPTLFTTAVSKEVVLSNTGLVPFKFAIHCPPHSHLRAEPSGGTLFPAGSGSRSTTPIQLVVDPSVPRHYDITATLRVGFLEPRPIRVAGVATFQRMALSLPRETELDDTILPEPHTQEELEAEADRLAVVEAVGANESLANATTAVVTAGGLRPRRVASAGGLNGMLRSAVYATYRHSFGPVLWDGSATVTFTLKNYGPSKMTFTPDQQLMASHGLKMDPPKLSPVAVGDSTTIKIELRPQSLKTRDPNESSLRKTGGMPFFVNIPIRPNNGMGVAVRFEAVIVTPRLSTIPPSLSFGEVFLGQAQKLRLKLHNAEPLPCDFAVTQTVFNSKGKTPTVTLDPPAGTVPPTGDLEIDAIFTPIEAGKNSASVALKVANSKLLHVSATGTGVDPEITIGPSEVEIPAMLPRSTLGSHAPVELVNNSAHPIEVFCMDFDSTFRKEFAARKEFGGYLDDRAIIPIENVADKTEDAPIPPVVIVTARAPADTLDTEALVDSIAQVWGADVVRGGMDALTEEIAQRTFPPSDPVVFHLSELLPMSDCPEHKASLSKGNASRESLPAPADPVADSHKAIAQAILDKSAVAVEEGDSLSETLRTMPFPVHFLALDIPAALPVFRSIARIEEQIDSLPDAPELPTEVKDVDEEDWERMSGAERELIQFKRRQHKRELTTLRRRREFLQKQLLDARDELEDAMARQPVPSGGIHRSIVPDKSASDDGIRELFQEEVQFKPPAPFDGYGENERFEVVYRPKTAPSNTTAIRNPAGKFVPCQDSSVVFTIVDTVPKPPRRPSNAHQTPASPRLSRSSSRGSRASLSEAAEPAKTEPTPVHARWTIPAGKKKVVYALFKSDIACTVRRTLTFGVVGLSTRSWPVLLKATATLPAINTSPHVLLPGSNKGAENAVTGWIPSSTEPVKGPVTRLDSIGLFSFGSLRLNRHRFTPAPWVTDQGAVDCTGVAWDTGPEMPHKHHVQTVALVNVEPLPIKAKLVWRYGGHGKSRELKTIEADPTITECELAPPVAEKKGEKNPKAKGKAPPPAEPVRIFDSKTEYEESSCFHTSESELTIAPGELKTVQVLAYPDVFGPVEDQLLITMENNPSPVVVPFKVVGDVPRIRMASETVEFERLLLNRTATMTATITNSSSLHAVWRLSPESKEKLAKADMSIAPECGLLLGRRGQSSTDLTVTFQSKCVEKFEEDIVIEVYDQTEVPKAIVAQLVEKKPVPNAPRRKKDGKKPVDPYAPAFADALPSPIHTTACKVHAEGYRIGVELDMPDNAPHVDFENLRVNEVRETEITLRNTGVYDIRYKFLVSAELNGLLVVDKVGGILPIAPPETKQVKGAPVVAPGKVKVAFGVDREFFYASNKAMLVQIIEDATGEVVDTLPIPAKASATFNKWKLTPARSLSFGALADGAVKTRQFELANTGAFPFNFTFGQSEEIKRIEQARFAAAAEQKTARLTAVKNGEVAPVRPSTGAKAPKPTKGETPVLAGDPVVVTPAELGGELTLAGGMFTLTPAHGSVEPGSSVQVSVAFTAHGQWAGTELIGLDITGRDPAESAGPEVGDIEPENLCGVRYTVDGESSVPGIDVENYASIFEEHKIVSRAGEDTSVVDDTFVFVRQGKDGGVFQFGQVLPGVTKQARYKLTNPFKVPVALDIAVDGRDPARPSTSSGAKGAKTPAKAGKPADEPPSAFTVEPSHVYLAPRQSVYVTCSFKPTHMAVYEANFAVTAEVGETSTQPVTARKGGKGASEPKQPALAAHQQLRFTVRGEGSLPHIQLTHPEPVPASEIEARLAESVVAPAADKTKGKGRPGSQSKPRAGGSEVADQYALFFGKNMMNTQTHRKVVVRCVGQIAATVRGSLVRSVDDQLVRAGGNCPFRLNGGALVSVDQLDGSDSATIQVTYAPASDSDHDSKFALRLTVDNNEYETVAIPLFGTAYSTDIVAAELPGDETSIVRIGDAFTGASKTVSFKLVNTSRQLFTFDWKQNDEIRKRLADLAEPDDPKAKTKTAKKPAKAESVVMSNIPDGVTVEPESGELGPGQELLVDVTFRADEPVAYTPDTTALQCYYRPVLPEGETSEEVCLRLGLVCTCGNPEFSLGIEPEDMKFVEDGEEVTVKSYHIQFAGTIMYETRAVTVPLANTGSVAVEYSWMVERKEIEGDIGVQADPGFTVAPAHGSVPPGETAQLSFQFHPQQAMAYEGFAALTVAGLEHEMEDEAHAHKFLVYLDSATLQPDIHFNLDVSQQYLLNTADLRPPESGWERSEAKVFRIDATGLRVRKSGHFTAIVPVVPGQAFTREPTFRWLPVGDKPKSLAVTTASGSLIRDQATSSYRKQMSFEFIPTHMERVEAYLNLEVSVQGRPRNIVPFLVLGFPSEPDVSVNRSSINFGSLLIGSEQEQVKAVTLTNNSEMTLSFRDFAVQLARGDKTPPAVTIEPAEGHIDANSSVELAIKFRPTEEREYNYQIVGRVDRKETPISINVKGVGFAVHEELILAGPEPVKLRYDSPSEIDLGTIFLQEKRAQLFRLVNNGRFPMNFAIRAPDNRHMSVLPVSGTVAPGAHGELTLSFFPQTEVTLKETVAVSVASGHKYLLDVTGKAVRPKLAFNLTKHDFGPQFIYHGGMSEDSIAHVDIVITNKDQHTLSVDPGFDATKVPHLEMRDAAPTILAPGESTTFRLMFKPRQATHYRDMIPFVINGLLTMHVTVEGSGTPLALECASKDVSIGAINVGTKRTREVRFTNRSKAPMKVKLCMPSIPPYLRVGLVNETVAPKRRPGMPEQVKSTATPTPQEEIELKPDHHGMVMISYEPRGRTHFNDVPVSVEVAGDVIELFKVSGAALGRSLRLDTEQLVFPPVVYGNKVTRVLKLQNDGDIDTHFRWDIEKLKPHFSIDKTSGVIDRNSDIDIVVTFEPTSIDESIVVRDVQCAFVMDDDSTKSVHDPVAVTFSGASVAVASATETIALECPVRGTAVKTVSIANPTEREWRLRPSVMATSQLQKTIRAAKGESVEEAEVQKDDDLYGGQPFSTVDVLVVPARGSKDITVTFKPQRMTTEPVLGSLLVPLPDGTAKLISLEGTATAPEDAGHHTWETIAKFSYKTEVDVSNWLPVSQRFTAELVLRDAYEAKIDVPKTSKSGSRPSSRRQSSAGTPQPGVSRGVRNPALLESASVTGPAAIDVPSLTSRDYAITFFSHVAGVFLGDIVLTNARTGEYIKHTFEYTARPPGVVSAISLETLARKPAVHTLRLENPLESPVTFTSACPDAAVFLPQTVALKPKSSSTIDVTYRPLVPTDKGGPVETELTFTSDKLGVLRHKLSLTARDPPPEESLHFECPLGNVQEQIGRITSLKDSAVTYKVSCDSADFTVPATLAAPAATDVNGVEVQIPIQFVPSSLGDTRAIVTIADPSGGTFTIPLSGRCKHPQPQGPFDISLNGSVQIQFKSPFKSPVVMTYQILGGSSAFILPVTRETLAPDKAINITVQYKPTTPVRAPATLVVSATTGSEGGLVRWEFYLNGKGN
ncbi:Flagellar-associated PapD-like [Carpediemonas membranifera]|uniref:Flagellar-associated PapD-like n=1 Tax=Carpediemonas membranifera TaxID=201153 RepID=A0A8J6ASR6_9EUKA|nr:Flagellar-associated PapD-like [Carpediemonas membranifera]|eukprot:KAG9391445.1 Flagellar-associated PapD-like [Carpediemonas membranifera]